MIAVPSTSPPVVVSRSKLVMKRFTAVDRGIFPGVTALPVFDFRGVLRRVRRRAS